MGGNAAGAGRKGVAVRQGAGLSNLGQVCLDYAYSGNWKRCEESVEREPPQAAQQEARGNCRHRGHALGAAAAQLLPSASSSATWPSLPCE